MNIRGQYSFGRRDVLLWRRWRWLILGSVVLAIFALELLEHETITDPHFLREAAVYGLAIPVIIWLILTLLANQTDGRADAETRTGWYRDLIQRLDARQEWAELTSFIVSFPATCLPVEHVSLFIYDRALTKLHFVTEWNAAGQEELFAGQAADAYSPCTWILNQASGLHQGCACPLNNQAAERCAARHFCLPLINNSELIGLLRLRSAPDQALPDQQVQFLNSMASHLALALALSVTLPRQVIEVQRQERRRLAYELHDSLAQQVGYLHLTLDRLGGDSRVEDSLWLRSEFDRLREVAGASYLQVRDSLDLLQRQDTVNLTQMVEEYLRKIDPQVPFKVEYHLTGNPMPLGPLTTQYVFGLIHESFNNIQKHALARQVCLELCWSDRWLEISVTDDGVGFDVVAMPAGKHYGLRMLRERVLELHGEMQLDSTVGLGTSLHFKIPLLTL